MRAVAVSVSAASAAAGFIQPGDVVDVILTHDVSKATPRGKPGGETAGVRYTAETILERVGVLAIDQEAGTLAEDARVAKTVTLQVTPAQAQKLSVARLMGGISLALRAPGEDNAPDGKAPVRATTDLDTSPTLSSRAKAAKPDAAKPDTPARRAPSRRIRVFRGAAASNERF